jgi:hypothetical protein
LEGVAGPWPTVARDFRQIALVGCSTSVDQAAAAAHQNQDAQAQPVNSKEWAALALGLDPGFKVGTTSAERTTQIKQKLSQLLAKYNGRPDVVTSATQLEDDEKKGKKRKTCDDDGDDLGILVGEKRARTIGMLLNKSFTDFWKLIDVHLTEYVFAYSACSEKLWSMKALWAESVIEHEPSSMEENRAPTNQQYLQIDWTLPLSSIAHIALGKRVHLDFRRATATIASTEKKASKRKNAQELMLTRNIMALWHQRGVEDLHRNCLEKDHFDELKDRIRHFVLV